METTPGSRIKARRKELHLTQKDVARAVGVSNVAVMQWESDMQLPKSDNAEALCAVLKLSWQQIRYGTNGDNDETPSSYKPVPIIDKEGISGYLSHQDAPISYASAKAAAMRDAVGGSKETFAFIEASDGMKPRIGPGDTVFIDPEVSLSECKPNDILLFIVNAQALLGTISKTPRGMMLCFDNAGPGWEPIAVKDDDYAGRLVAYIPAWLDELNTAIKHLK